MEGRGRCHFFAVQPGCITRRIEPFVQYARSFGVVLTLAQAEEAQRAWLSAWSEMDGYFAWTSSKEQNDGTFLCEQHGPGGMTTGWRNRRAWSFPQAANTMFQGLAADGAKAAGWAISKECYTVPDSPLFGSRIVLFVHDEYVIEAPRDRLCYDAEHDTYRHPAGERLSELMVEGMRLFTPDIRIDADYDVHLDRWAK